MKKLFLILFIGLLACSFFGCEIPPPPCKATKIQRPALSSDALQWVQVADTAPYFKVTSYDLSGQISSIDTLQGHYTYTLEDKQNFGNTECETIHYQEARCKFIIMINKAQIKEEIIVNNYKKNKGYECQIYSGIFNEETVLDTAYINGVLYKDVYKVPRTSFKINYAKGVGIICDSISNLKIEFIP